MTQELRTLVLTLVECGHCGVAFGLSKDYQARRRNDHKTFYCPNGHNRYYPQQSREERLQDERDRLQRERDRQASKIDHLSRSRAALRGKVTLLKRRAASGKCPCCSKRFSDLASHMHDVHPGYGVEPE